MIRRIYGAALTLAWLAAPMCGDAAMAQGIGIPANAAIEITYGPADNNPAHAAIRARLVQGEVLEQLQRFLSPLTLSPRRLRIETAQCGDSPKPYESGAPATICYEYIEQLYKLAPTEAVTIGDTRLTRDVAITGAFVQRALHEVALAVFDILELPVWGRESDAADRLAAYIMLQFGPDLAYRTILGAAWFFNATERPWTVTEFADLRQTEAQRFFNYLCIAYGNERLKDTFKFLVTDRYLPSDRCERCSSDHMEIEFAFQTTILRDHVNQDLLKQVQAAEWLK